MATITQFPQAISLQSGRVSPGCVAEYRPGEGWSGSDALFCRAQLSDPGDGSRGQGYGGYEGTVMPPTKRLNVRLLVKLNHADVPRNKWLVVRKRDGSVDLSGCQRFIVEDKRWPGNRRPIVQQGVCTPFDENSANILNWNDRIGQWVCLEFEGDLNTGFYRMYVSTEDGALNNALWSELNISEGANPEVFADQTFWAMDGMHWDEPDPGNHGAFISDMVVSDTFIGNPFTGVVPVPAPTPVPAPVPAPAPAYTGGRFHVMVNGVEISWHTQEKEAYEAAGRFILNNPTAIVTIQTDVVRVTLE